MGKRFALALCSALLLGSICGCSDTGYMTPSEAGSKFEWSQREVVEYAIEETSLGELLAYVYYEYGIDAIFEYAAAGVDLPDIMSEITDTYGRDVIDALVDEFGPEVILDHIYDGYY